MLSATKAMLSPCWYRKQTKFFQIDQINHSCIVLFSITQSICPPADIENKQVLPRTWFGNSVLCQIALWLFIWINHDPPINHHPSTMRPWETVKYMKYLLQACQTLLNNWIQFLLSRKQIVIKNLKNKIITIFSNGFQKRLTPSSLSAQTGRLLLRRRGYRGWGRELLRCRQKCSLICSPDNHHQWWLSIKLL